MTLRKKSDARTSAFARPSAKLAAFVAVSDQRRAISGFPTPGSNAAGRFFFFPSAGAGGTLLEGAVAAAGFVEGRGLTSTGLETWFEGGCGLPR